MDLNGQVGEVAGKVWHTLNSEWPQTVLQLKKKLNATGDLVNFGVGWLAREDKVLISQEKSTFRIQLK
jgi:Winged helix-turn-helix domain (DUF2582)